jgi:hypothetical protein
VIICHRIIKTSIRRSLLTEREIRDSRMRAGRRRDQEDISPWSQ